MLNLDYTHQMKHILFFLTICISFSSNPLAAQQRRSPGAQKGPLIKGKVSGVLVDSLSGEKLEFASVAVVSSKDQKVINGTLTDAEGEFKVPEIPLGTYQLRVTFIGYQTKFVEEVTLTPKKPDTDLGKIMLSPADVQLDEVEITSERAVIENKVDRIVYNADQDITTVGGTAEDVLRKVPLLSVDINGNVSLRGNSNVQILMNGKPSGMFANSVADAIKMIPADEIKSVEVITTPGAKYDAEGSGGIINIITKKKSISGISGTFTGSVGNLQNNANLSINAGKGRFGLNGGANMYHSWPRDSRTTFIREDQVANGLRVLDQEGITESSRTGFFGRFGMFYDLNAYNSFSSDVNFRGFQSDRDGFNDAILTSPTLNQMYRQNQVTDDLRTGYDWNTAYTRTFSKKDQEFSIATQVSGNISNTDISLERLSDDPSLLLREDSENDGDNLEVTLQTDYTHPITEKIKLEVGVKTILRDIDSDYLFRVFDGDTDAFEFDPSRSNSFDYDQDVYAGYVSFNINVGEKYTLQAGTRYERTDIAGQFSDGSNSFTNDYDNILPSIILNRKLKNFSNAKISYNQRIQRPSLFFINPFVNTADRRNISFGNPTLSPEITHQIELGYNTFVKGVAINAALYYRRTEDIIESILTVNEEGISITTYDNVGQNNSIGLNFFGSATIKKIWTLRGGFDLYTYDGSGVINGVEVSNTNILYRINANSSFKLPKGLRLEFFGFFNSPRQTLQGTNPSFWLYNLALKKDLFKERGSVGLTFIDPFNKFKNFNSDIEGDTFFQRTTFRLPFRSIGINFSYQFGKLDFKPQRRNTNKINNTDTKSGEQGDF